MIRDKAVFYGKGKGENRKTYFCVLNNFLDNYKASKEEKAEAKSKNLTVFFELYDDDDIKYYSGYANEDLMEENDLDMFSILDMATADSGCTYMKTRSSTGRMEIV